MDMTNGKPALLIVRFIIPVMIGNIFQQFCTMVDTIIVGRFVGTEALAAIGSAGQIVTFVRNITQGMTIGFAMITARYFGAGDMAKMKKSVGNAVILSMGMTVVVTLFSMLGMDGLLFLMNTPEDLFDMTRAYGMIICGGIFSSVFYNLLANLLRALGNSVVPFVSLVVASVINILLDYVLIVYARLGIAGAGYAMVIAQMISGLFCLWYVTKKVPGLNLAKNDLMPDSSCMSAQLMLGVPMTLQFTMIAIGDMILQSAVNLLGATVMAAVSVVNRILYLAAQPLEAMGVTMGTYCAQNSGISDLGRIRKGVRTAVVMCLIYVAVMNMLLHMVLPYVVPLFMSGEAEEVLVYVRRYILICGPCYVFVAFVLIFRNGLQGCGFGWIPMVGVVIEVAARSGVTILLNGRGGLDGICGAHCTAWISSGLSFAFLYVVLMRAYQVRLNEYGNI